MHACISVQFCYTLAFYNPSGIKLLVKNVSGHFFLLPDRFFHQGPDTWKTRPLERIFFHVLPSGFCIGCYEISSAHITGIPEGQFICLTLHKPSQNQMGLWDSQHVFVLFVLLVIQNCAMKKEGSRDLFKSVCLGLFFSFLFCFVNLSYN